MSDETRRPKTQSAGFNVKWVLSNLREAKEQLDELIDDFETGDYYDSQEELQVQWRHAYYHLNLAWNGATSGDVVWKSTDEEFDRLSRFDLEAFEDLHPEYVDPGYGDEG